MKTRLSEFRDAHGWTQEVLAHKAGTSRQTVISIEKGRYDPGLKLAMRLARAFDVTVEELFELDD